MTETLRRTGAVDSVVPTSEEQVRRRCVDLLAAVSHELRAPVHAILGWTAILRSGSASAQKLEHALEVIERNARAQVRLIEDLLDIARASNGKLRLELQPVDLCPIARRTVETLAPSAQAKHIELQLALDPERVVILGDGDRLQQIICNLCANAIKFTSPGGRITVRVDRLEGHARLVVEDSGIGIGPELLPQVFERFRQGWPAGARRSAGIGLGLNIVRGLVEAHGGSVRAASAGVGRGATFTVELPLAP